MKTVDFLDAVRARHGLTSDYQLAKKLGWHPSRVSGYRTKAREFDDDSCLQIAKALDLPAPYVMACIAAARAKSAESKHAWERAAKLLKSGTAATLLMAALLMAQNAPSSSSAQQPTLNQQAIHYAQRRRLLEQIERQRRRRRKSRPVTPSTANCPDPGNTAHV